MKATCSFETSSLLATCFHAGFFLGLFYPEDEGNMFFFPKRRFHFNGLHGVTPHKVELFSLNLVHILAAYILMSFNIILQSHLRIKFLYEWSLFADNTEHTARKYTPPHFRLCLCSFGKSKLRCYLWIPVEQTQLPSTSQGESRLPTSCLPVLAASHHLHNRRPSQLHSLCSSACIHTYIHTYMHAYLAGLDAHVLYTKGIVTFIPIARQRLGKHITSRANARDNRSTIARQRRGNHASSTIQAVFCVVPAKWL
jgi:hypothetical protein